MLGIFQEQLAKLIVGFRKEQVNANLLNGKGEITNVSLNCSIINESISKVSPFFELESVRISKLSFNVTSWANLKKAPLCIVVEDVHAVIVEPLHFIPKDQRRSLKQISRHKYKEMIKGKKQRGSYSLLDRILDNLQIEVRSVNISFQPRGKFKTRQTGPWTPPSLKLVIRHIMYQSVNEFGNPASPDDCWRHNTFQGRSHEQKLRIFKSMSMVVEAGLEANDESQISIIEGAKVELQIIFHKRVHDAAILSIQADINVNQIEILVKAEDIGTFAHAVAGFKYCFAKDRAFQDPLLGGLPNITVTDSGDVGIKLAESNSSTSLDQSEVVTNEFDDDESDDEYDDDDDDDRPKEYDTIAFGDFGISGIEAIMKSVTNGHDQTEMTAAKSDIDDTTVISSSIHSEKSTATMPHIVRDRPVIIFPTGIVIHERVSFSLSIHHCTVRCTYTDKKAPENSFVQVSVKGMIAEIIWPKSTGEKGLHLQISMSYISIQELFGDRIRFLMIGGIQGDMPTWPVERRSPCVAEILSDETFPLFVDRCIQPDPLRLRQTFPAQAVGIKSTVSCVDNVACPDQESLMVLNELGLDQFEITLDTESWCRMLRLILNEARGGFDPRWNTGDWSDVLKTEMLVHPSQPLNLADHVQETNKIFLDANEMMSSDLFNVTGRIRNVYVRAPAAISKDVRSCDIEMKLGELMLVISSALPRTFLIGKLGSSISCDDRDGASLIEFPNDPSDICYELERTEDPCLRQQGTMTARRVSTFRSQITVKDLSVNLVPAIPFCNHSKPQELVAPLEFTFIACFEGELPEIAESDDMKLVLFVSVQIHRIAINCDFDLMSGAASTVIHHVRVVQNSVANTKLSSNIKAKALSTDITKSISQISDDSKVSATTNRHITTRRQFQKSRETGGLTLSLCAHFAEVSVSLWRQNVPISSQFRASVRENCTYPMEGSVIPILQLIELHLISIEVGVEANFRHEDRRVVLKCCLTNMKIDICDFEKECSLYPLGRQERQSDENENLARSKERFMHEPAFEPCMMELVSIGGPNLLDTSPSDDVTVRVEERVSGTCEISSSVHIGCGGVIYLHVQEVETVIFLLLEALLLPTGMIHQHTNKQFPAFEQKSTFPTGSIGALLTSFAARPTKKNQEEPQNPIETQFLIDNGDKMIKTLILSRLPGNISTFLNRLSVNKLLVLVPRKPRDENSCIIPSYGLFLTEAVSLTGFFAGRNDTENSSDPILDVIAHSKSTWDELFIEKSTGFHQTISMTQSLHEAEPINSGKLTQTIVPAFTVQGKYLGSKLDFSLGDSTLTVLDVRNLTDFHLAVTQLVDRIEATRKRVEGLMAALQVEIISKKDCGSTRTTFDKIAKTEFPDVEGPLGATKAYLHQLSFLIARHELSVQLAMNQKQKRVETLEFQVFSKERARLAALALVASQAAGWLRMGGSHTHGQRAPTVANMWRYFVVLRKSLLILYAAPGKLIPLDIVSLQGARLHCLTGGRKKSDVRHGFAIVENTGKARLFIALNGPEYESWIKELHIATTTYSTQQLDDGQVDTDLAEDFPEIEGEESPSILPGQHELKSISTRIRVRTLSSEMDPSTRVDFDHASRRPAEKVRASFSNLTAAAKNKLAVARENRKRTKSDNESECDDGVESHEAMRLSTLGIEDTVLLSPTLYAESTTDHNKPLEVISANDEHCESDDDQEAAAGAQIEHQETPSSIDDDNISIPVRGSHVGKRFASLRSSAKNRVSGAVQAAIEKSKAVAEHRKNQKELQSEGVDGRQQSQAGDMEEGGSRHRLGSLKNRLGGVTSSMKKRLDKADDSIPMLATDSWDTAVSEQPKAVDDLNSPFGNGVEQIRDVVTWEDAPPEIFFTTPLSVVEMVSGDASTLLAVVEASVAKEKEDEESTESGKARPRFGARVKHLGASIRSRRALSPKVQSVNRDEEKGRFSMRGRFTKQNGLEDFGADFEETSIRGVNIGDRHQRFGEPCLPIPGILLEKINSDFIVQVVPYIFQPGETVPYHSNPGIGSERGLSEICSVDHSFFDKVSVSENHLSTDGKEYPTFTLLQNGFKITRITNNFLLSREMRSSRSVKTILCTFTDLLSLYTSISDSVAIIGPMSPSSGLNEIPDAALAMKEDLATALGLSTLDYVKVTGGLLGGLIEASKQFERLPAFREYECEILTEFLNSTLNCPLPEEARRAIISFLRIEDYELQGSFASLNLPVNDTIENVAQNVTDSMLTGSETILALTSAVQTEILRAEAKEMLSQREANAKSPLQKLQQNSSRQPSAPPYLEPLLPSTISDGLRKSLHEALIMVMAERDEAHARMIAASVMHVHEVEQERKKVSVLVEKLMIAQSLAASVTSHDIAGFVNPFQNNNAVRDKARKESEENLKKLSDRMLQNTDIELIALCEQLSGEIASKTSKSLEILRLNESRKIEKEYDLAEKQALQAELKRVKEALAVQQAKFEEAQHDTIVWKEAYEELEGQTQILPK